MLTPVTVSVCALFFTVLSFWAIYVRRGRLQSYEPNTFSFGMDPARVVLRLPLVLYNTGAVPIVVRHLRLLWFYGAEGPPAQSLPWVGSLPHIKPVENEARQFPAVFSVAGRTAHQMFPEFNVPSLDFAVEARNYPMAIEIKLGQCEEWQLFLAFTLHADQITAPGVYITYENAPPSPERYQEAKVALADHPPNRRARDG